MIVQPFVYFVKEFYESDCILSKTLSNFIASCQFRVLSSSDISASRYSIYSHLHMGYDCLQHRYKEMSGMETSSNHDHSRHINTWKDVAYGPHPRNILDFYQAGTEKPAPLLVNIHGGGWMGGGKHLIFDMVDVCIPAGISVASIEYRLILDAVQDGLQPPVKAPMEDAARAVQFLRSRAKEWSIDPARVAGTGGSAGACTTLWLAFHKDLADPSSSDPVSRESTKFSCVWPRNAQTSLDPRQLTSWLPNYFYGAHAFGYFKPDGKSGDYARFLQEADALDPLLEEYSPYALADADSPPVGLFYEKAPPPPGELVQDPTHSAVQGIELKKKLDSLGIKNYLVYPGSADADMTLLRFLQSVWGMEPAA
ncbi:MAG TPA: lipase [Clostridiales bacterium]|nr:lipase [Clostridiales bacterium]